MATGIITEITEESGNIKTGRIALDEAKDEVIFEKQTITCGKGDPVSFDLEITSEQPSKAINIQCITTIVDHVLSPLKTPYNGDVTISDSEKLVVKSGGSVTGKIIIEGGKLKVAGGDVKGEITIMKSGSLIMNGGKIEGKVLSNGAELIKITGNGDVKGEITIMKGHKLVLDGATIHGGLIVKDAYKIVVKSNSSITCS